MRAGPLAELLDEATVACHDADPTEWTPEERDDVLAGLTTVSYEIPALAARIRAAKVNDTKVPHPVKPGPKPVDKPADPEPEPAPPADPEPGQ